MKIPLTFSKFKEIHPLLSFFIFKPNLPLTFDLLFHATYSDNKINIHRQNKLTEAAHRYKYALKRLGSIVNTDWAEGERMQESDWPLEMETNLLLNLSRVERRLGRFQTSIQLASKVLDQNPACVQVFLNPDLS